MLLRPATMAEAPILTQILVDRLPDTRYHGHVKIEQPLARKMLANAVHRHNGTTDGATFVMVAEGDEGIDAFVFGVLNRVYHVGDMLCAQDVFLIGRKDCDPRALSGLLAAYMDWGLSNPRVFEVFASWIDTIPGAERMGAAYRRKGFTKCGEIWRRTPATEGGSE